MDTAGLQRLAGEVRLAVADGGLLTAERLGGRQVIVMLSGGRDSVCLLDLVVSFCETTNVQALHVNYGVRLESQEDERHCEQLCQSLGVKLHTRHPRKPEEAGNLQAWARRVRYDAALGLPGQEDALVATGHTASDQVETILYRLAASPGRRALLGMLAAEGRLIRPLLGVTREQTTAYCLTNGLGWREDSSNDSDIYARGRVRHALLPALRKIHPAAESNVLRTAELLREETELLESLVERELNGESSIATTRLGKLPGALQRLVLVRLAEDAAGTFVPQAGERVQELLALGERGGRAELHVGGLVSAVIERGRLRMIRIQAHYPPPSGH